MTYLQRSLRAIRRYNEALEQYRAATKLQSMARRDAAIKKVDKIRAQKFDRMNQAATYIRKMWLGARTRRKYLELMEEFSRHVQKVVTMQRYARGFLVRLRMWRQAVRAEEELWGALEIQRVWQREMAAVRIQRHIRGWLARTKVGRIRRKIARAEFERARRRFRAAQRIQALLRASLVRKKFVRRFVRARRAAVHIQRVVRGHALRKGVWQQVKVQKAIAIQAHVRGFLVRRRKLHLIAKVICIQRGWRQWLRQPQDVRDAAVAQRKDRKEKAAVSDRCSPVKWKLRSKASMRRILQCLCIASLAHQSVCDEVTLGALHKDDPCFNSTSADCALSDACLKLCSYFSCVETAL
eukprot:Skav205103  [mRNA]  locus=scaffold2214:257947:284779:+ [translate_table: standard]